MKKVYILFCTCLFLLTADAQIELSPDYSFSVSEPYEVIDGDKEYFHHGNNIIAIKQFRKNLYIQKFNSETLQEVTRIEYKLEDLFPKDFIQEDIIQLQDKCYYFYSSWSGKKTKHERLYYKEIDLNTGKISEESIKLIDVAGKLAGTQAISNGKFRVVDKFDLYISNDESKLLINYRKKPEVKRDIKSYDIIGVNVFDQSLSGIWSNEYKMPHTERRMDELDFTVDTDGKVYMLSKVFHDDSYKSKKTKDDKVPNYHIELFRFLNDSGDIQITKIELREKFIKGISLFELNNNMLCAGYYSKEILEGYNRATESDADGVFVFKISENGEIVDRTSHEIPLEIKNQYVSDKTKKKKKSKRIKFEIKTINLNDVVIDDDGSILMIGEQYQLKSGKFGQTVNYYYDYNDIFMTKIDAKGNLLWMKKLPKRQRGRAGLGGMSYFYFNTKGNHHLIFLDNLKNIDLALNKNPALHADGYGGYFTAYKINDTTGEVSKANIFDTTKVTDKLEVHQFSNNRLVKTAENEFIAEFYKKDKEDVLIKVEIN
ncbi:hypothetical protein [Winogradskyella forsetii]|uniref:hypothetical protein n=1 Tax=Winogradskyella forsetii TaxID=2686077 RepID=UPI0015BAF322|nr:hypothetical protein [Winogradskyella forsetii]